MDGATAAFLLAGGGVDIESSIAEGAIMQE